MQEHSFEYDNLDAFESLDASYERISTEDRNCELDAGEDTSTNIDYLIDDGINVTGIKSEFESSFFNDVEK